MTDHTCISRLSTTVYHFLINIPKDGGNLHTAGYFWFVEFRDLHEGSQYSRYILLACLTHRTVSSNFFKGRRSLAQCFFFPRPFSQNTRDLFLPLLSDPEWWAETTFQLRQLHKVDDGFNERMFQRQMAVMKGQGWNIVQSLRHMVRNFVMLYPAKTDALWFIG